MRRLRWPLGWALSVFRGLPAVVNVQLHPNPARPRSKSPLAGGGGGNERGPSSAFLSLLQTLRFPPRGPSAPRVIST